MTSPNQPHATHPRAEYAKTLAPNALIPGTVVCGKYRIERVLGEGGMGIVVAARHLQLDVRVAIKCPHRELLDDPVLTKRFLREARMAVKIRSEHVARVFDVASFDDGSPFIVMEYLDGCDLAALLCAEGPLSERTAVEYVLQACRALSEAHAHGIVHRDLKPENLFLTRRADGSPCIKVLDFGIAKSLASATRTGMLVGSPIYMSPEQLRSEEVDVRADVWALGVVLFELITGQQPFVGDSLVELSANILDKPTPSLAAVKPDASPAVTQAILRCLEKDRGERFRGVSELATALAPALSVRSIVPPPLGSEDEPPFSHTSPAVALGERREVTLALPTLRVGAPLHEVVPLDDAVSAAPTGIPKSAGAAWLALAGVGLIVLAAGGWLLTNLIASREPPRAEGIASEPRFESQAAPTAEATVPPPTVPPPAPEVLQPLAVATPSASPRPTALRAAPKRAALPLQTAVPDDRK